MTRGCLRGWKRIAEFLDCCESTARREHKKNPMPLRGRGKNGQPLFLPDEMIEWLKKNKPRM